MEWILNAMLTYPANLLQSPRYRGERNNNPLNLDRGTPPIPWLGLAPAADQAQDARFGVFVDPQHGIRAAALNMQTHALRATSTYSIDLDRLVQIWAPATENDTVAYIDSVAHKLGLVSPSIPVRTNDLASMRQLIQAFITHENGRCIYPDSIITEGLALLPGWQV